MRIRQIFVAAMAILTLSPSISKEQTKPCPPPNVSVQGGTTAAMSCEPSKQAIYNGIANDLATLSCPAIRPAMEALEEAKEAVDIKFEPHFAENKGCLVAPSMTSTRLLNIASNVFVANAVGKYLNITANVTGAKELLGNKIREQFGQIYCVTPLAEARKRYDIMINDAIADVERAKDKSDNLAAAYEKKWPIINQQLANVFGDKWPKEPILRFWDFPGQNPNKTITASSSDDEKALYRLSDLYMQCTTVPSRPSVLPSAPTGVTVQ